MNGEKHNGEQQKGAEDLWAPVTVPTDQPAAHDRQQTNDQQLTATGHGDKQRAVPGDEAAEPLLSTPQEPDREFEGEEIDL